MAKVITYDPTTCHIGDQLSYDPSTSIDKSACQYPRTTVTVNPEAMEYMMSLDPRKNEQQGN